MARKKKSFLDKWVDEQKRKQAKQEKAAEKARAARAREEQRAKARAARKREEDRSRAQVRAEKERERARIRAEKEKERAQIRAEKEHERAQVAARKEQERESQRLRREHEKLQKEEEKQALIRGYEAEVSEVQAFLEGITTLHARPFEKAEHEEEYSGRLIARPFLPTTFQPASFGETLEQSSFFYPPFQPLAYAKWVKDEAAPALPCLGWLAITLGWLLPLGSVPIYVVPCLGLVVVAVVSPIRRRVLHKRFLEKAEAEHDRLYEKAQSLHEAEAEAKQADFEQRKAAFVAGEKERRHLYETTEEAAREHWEDREEDRVEILEEAAKGNPNALELLVEALLPIPFRLRAPWEPCTNLEDHEVAYQVLPDGNVLLVIHLPDFDLVPGRTAEMNAAGNKIKYLKLNKTRRSEIYDEFVASFSLAHVVSIFEACTAVAEVVVETCLLVADEATGHDKERLLLRAQVSRDALYPLQLERVKASACLSSFDHEILSIGSRAKKVPEPTLDREALTWATPDDEGFEFPPGLIDLSEGDRLPNPHAQPV
jgi:hypothetical protein